MSESSVDDFVRGMLLHQQYFLIDHGIVMCVWNKTSVDKVRIN